jgi:hypothetical protein
MNSLCYLSSHVYSFMPHASFVLNIYTCIRMYIFTLFFYGLFQGFVIVQGDEVNGI